jgi:beta-lactamase regulating signal transducer with metallopeptidase domain
MIDAIAALGTNLAATLPRATAVVCIGLGTALLLRRRTGWQHVVVLSSLGAQLILVAHAVLTPSLTWRVLPESVTPMVAPLTEVAVSLERTAAILPGISASTAPAHEGGWTLAAVLGMIWLIGSGLLLFRIARGHVSVRRHHRVLVSNPTCHAALHHARTALGLQREIDLVVDSTAGQPYAFGIRRPGIALPPESEHWTSAETRAVLAHEAAHIARGDLFANLIGHLATAAMWPNPLVHLARRRAELLREQLADAEAVSTGIAPADYVTSVISAIRSLVHTAPGTAVPLARQRHTLAHRMRAVLALGAMRPGNNAANHAVTMVATPVIGIAGAALAIGLPLVAPPPLCEYRNGPHLDVQRPTSGHRTHWLVQWTGEGCRVEWRATGAAAIDPVEGTITLPSVLDSIEVVIHNNGSRRSVVAFHAPASGLQYRVDSGPHVTRRAPEWFPGFLVELERHTAVARAVRLPALLASGGVAAVFAETHQMSGGHAAALYLTELVMQRQLSAGEFVELLDVVHDAPSSNDAALEQLLLMVADRAPIHQVPVREGFVAAMHRLTAVAARERVSVALSAASARHS